MLCSSRSHPPSAQARILSGEDTQDSAAPDAPDDTRLIEAG
jgi:hypothetical protein